MRLKVENNYCVITIQRKVTNEGQIYYKKSIDAKGITKTELLGVIESIKMDILNEMDKALPDLIKKLNEENINIPLVNVIEERAKNAKQD